MPKDWHVGLHDGYRGGDYNKWWWDEIEKLEDAGKLTTEAVLRLKDQISSAFGFAEGLAKPI